MVQAGTSDSSALAISTVVHLNRRLDDLPAPDGHARGKPDNTTSTLFG
jgi:hypothetical protein